MASDAFGDEAGRPGEAFGISEAAGSRRDAVGEGRIFAQRREYAGQFRRRIGGEILVSETQRRDGLGREPVDLALLEGGEG